jgi:Rap1a immunity proteins
MTLRIIAALAAALLIGSNAYAREESPPKTGNDFLDLCSAAQPTKMAEALILMHCLGHGVGFAEGLAFWQEVHPEFASICIPEEVDAEQLRQVTLRFIRGHPEISHYKIGLLMAMAYREAWPCKKPRRD